MLNRYLEKIASLKDFVNIISGKSLERAKASYVVRKSALDLAKTEAKQAVHNYAKYKVRPDYVADEGAKFARKHISETYRGKFGSEAALYRKAKNNLNSVRNKTFLARGGAVVGTASIGAATLQKDS